MRVSIILKVYPQMTFDASLTQSLWSVCNYSRGASIPDNNMLNVVEVDFGM